MSKPASRFSALFKALALVVIIGATIVYIANFRPADSGVWFGSHIAPARAAYPFELTDQDGNRFRLADQRGNVILLNFGFTNCPNMPDIASALGGHLSAAPGFHSPAGESRFREC